MASKESTSPGESTGGSSVRRAAAVAALTEEPTAGLFPKAAPATPATSATSATKTTAATTGTATATEALAEAATEADPKPDSKAETKPDTAPAAEAAQPTVAAGTATVTAEQPLAATESAPEAAKATTTETPAKSATESAAEARLAGATRTESKPARAAALPLGRPKKPMIAAAVLGGLVLIGVPFLISGSGDGPKHKANGQIPAGSRMNPDGNGPGLVPGEERVSSKSDAKDKGGEAERSTGLGGSLHERGERGEGGSGGAGDGDKGGRDSGEKGSSSAEKDSKSSSGGDTSKDSSGDSTSRRAPAAPPAVATYSHLIGLGCNTPGFATGDFYTDGKEGWRKSWDSTTAYGCNGLFYSLPMSGSSTSDGIWAQWKFKTGEVQKGSCSVQVYIPNVRDVSYVGGSPAYYTVYRYFEQKSSNKVGSFQINQAAHLGQWVSAGTFPVSDGKISVVLDNRGDGSNNRHAAAAPVRVNCKAS